MSEKPRLVKRYLDFIFRYYRIILVLYISVMGFLVYRSFTIRINSDLYALFPQKLESIQNISKMEKYYGGTSNTTLSIKFKIPDQVFMASTYRLKKYHRDYLDSIHEVLKNYIDMTDNISLGDTATIKKIYAEYLEDMSNFLPVLDRELKTKDASDKRYTQLFHTEYYKYIQPDMEHRYTTFAAQSIKKNLLILQDGFQQNLDTINKYRLAMVKSLPNDRKNVLTTFVEHLSNELEKHRKNVLFVDYKIQQKFIEDHLLYLIDADDIDYIDQQLQKRIDYERRKSILSSAIFVDANDADLDFSHLKEKYISTGQEGGRKFIRLQNPEEVFQGKSLDSEHQYYLSENQDSIFLSVRVRKGSINIDYAKQVIHLMQSSFDKIKAMSPIYKNLELVQTGPFIDRTIDAQVLAHDIARVTPLALSALCFIIAFYFRSFIAVPIIFFPLLSDMMCALGFVSVVYGYLNIVSSFLVALIAGLGVNFGTHLFSRYLEAKGKGKNVRDSLEEVYTTIFLSNITATTTTAAGFFVLSLCSFQGFREFGLIAGVGMLSLLFGIVVAFPSFLIFLEKLDWVRVKPREYKKIVKYKHKGFPLFKVVVLIGLSMIIYGLTHLHHLNFNADFKEMVEKPTDVPNDQQLFKEEARDSLKLSTGFGISPIYAPNLHVYHEVYDFILNYSFENPDFRVESLYVYYPADQPDKAPHILLLQKTLDNDLLKQNDDADVQNKISFIKRISKTPPIKSIQEIPISLQKLFVGQKPGYFILFYNIRSLSTISKIEASYRDFTEINRQFKDKGVFLSSDTWIFGDLLRVLKKEGPLLAIAIMVLFSGLLYLDFRSWIVVIASLLPLVAGFCIMIFLFIVLHLELNFFNILMLPVVAGLGLDYGVHSIHRIHEEGRDNLLFVFSTTGRTMWIAASQDMVGMLVLTTAMYHGLVTIGQVMITGIFSCLLCGSLLLPATIQWNEDRKKKGWFHSFFSWDGFLPQTWVDSLKKHHYNHHIHSEDSL